MQPSKIFRARKEDCGIPKPPVFRPKGREQCYESPSDNSSMTSKSSTTHSSGCCCHADRHRGIGASEEATLSRTTRSASCERRTESAAKSSPPIEKAVRAAFLSSNGPEGNDGLALVRPNQKLGASELMPTARSERTVCDQLRGYDGFSEACRGGRSAPSEQRCSTALRSTNSRYRRLFERSSGTSCFDLINTELSSDNQLGTVETGSATRATLLESSRTPSTPLDSYPHVEENVESSSRNLYHNNASSLQASPGSARASEYGRSDSPWDATSLAASFMDELSLHLIDTGDLLECTNTRDQRTGGTGDRDHWSALETGDRQQPRSAAQQESDLEERLAAWDPCQEDSYDLSVTGELELLEQELFDPRRPRTPVKRRDSASTPLTRSPTGIGTLSTALRQRKRDMAAEASPDTSIYDDLEWITEETGARLSDWTRSVGYTAAEELSRVPTPTADVEAHEFEATCTGRTPTRCCDRQPAAARSSAGELPTENTDKSSVASSTSADCFSEGEDAFIKSGTCGTSVGTEVVWKSSELQREVASSFVEEENDASLDEVGPEESSNDDDFDHGSSALFSLDSPSTTPDRPPVVAAAENQAAHGDRAVFRGRTLHVEL